MTLLLVGVLQELSGRGVSPRWPGLHCAGWCFTSGLVLFSGSLYALALSGWKPLGVFTPAGGLALLAGWGFLAWGALKPAPAAA